MKKLILFLGITLYMMIPNLTWGQYLQVSRSATIRENPGTQYTILERVNKNDCLPLLNNGEQSENGWYKVSCIENSNQNGWIYRTLVRRFEGDIPEAYLIHLDNPLLSNKIIEYESTIPENYYQGTEGLVRDELKAVLHNIIKGHTEYPYTISGQDDVDVWEILKITDRAANDPDQVVLLYTNRLRDAHEEYNHGRGWTREHVWAKSHGDFGTSKGAGTDVHHLRPLDGSVNSSRNNKDFDYGGTEYLDGNFPTGCKSDTHTWEPNDTEKGDVARMLFYMAVRYEGGTGELDLELTNDVDTPPQPLHGKLSTLLEWHVDDPVDDWERRRNDIIYRDFQHNRNPFIDYPEFAERIWIEDE